MPHQQAASVSRAAPDVNPPSRRTESHAQNYRVDPCGHGRRRGAGASPEAGWVAGEVIDQNLAITLPGVPVEAVGTGQVAYTDLDGRYRLELPAGTYEIRIVLAGYAETSVTVDVAAGQLSAVQVALGSNVFAEELVVTAPTLEPIRRPPPRR